MSIKIWNACRVPLPKFYKFLDETRKEAEEQVADIVKSYMGNLKPESIVKWMGDQKINPEIFITWLYFEFVENVLKPASASGQYRLTNLDCCLWVYLDSRYAYVIYSFPMYFARYLVLTTIPEYAQDFAYWNNTDKPDHISEKEWKARGKKWYTLLDRPAVRYDITSFEHNYHIEILNRIKND